MVEHVPLEPHATIATGTPTAALTVYSTLGRITLGRADMARTLGIPDEPHPHRRHHRRRQFRRQERNHHEPVLALLSKKTGRPVKGVFTRAEEFIASTTRHPLIMDYKTGVTKEGSILARKIRLVLDGGAYCSWSETTLGKACILVAPAPTTSKTSTRKPSSSTPTRP